MFKRIGWIDIAKCLCIFAVILGHRGIEQLGFVYSFHLTVFFILAGYTSKIKAMDGDLLKKWFRQLMKPYFLTCCAVLVMEIVNLVVGVGNFSTHAVTNLIAVDLKRFFFASGGVMNFGSIDMGRFIGAIWFLPAMFFARIIFQFIINSVKDKRIQIIISVLSAVLAVVLSNVVWLPFSILPGMFAVPFMLVGYYAKEYDAISHLKVPHYLLFAAVFLAGCITEYAQSFYMVNVFAKDYFLTPLFAFAGSFTIIGISILLEKIPSGVLRFFGKNSLIVLCVHLFEMNTLYGLYSKIISLLHLPDRKIVRLAMELIVICAVSVVLVYIKRFLENVPSSSVIENKRDTTVDIMRGFLIALMILCHTSTDIVFHRIVYSFHMIAFIIISGYFYRSGVPLKIQLRKSVKSLVYYAEFSVIYFFVSSQDIIGIIKTVLGGFSYTHKLFPTAVPVGPVYFILLLFVVRLLYAFIDCLCKGYMKDIVVLVVSLAGIILGKTGFWLFWSFDIAMFCLLFFHIAVYFRKYDILKKLNEMPYMYFVFSLCWFLFVHNGSMDLATRRYENIGILIAGTISAFILVYQLCAYIMRHWPKFIIKVITTAGESTAYILILHALFANRISLFVSDTLMLNRNNIFYLVVYVFIQLCAGMLVYVFVENFKKFLRKYIVKSKTARPSVSV